MRIWVIKVGELLPIDGARYRPHRIGMLADSLLERHHEVVWWASTLDHSCKQQRFHEDTTVRVGPRYTIRLLHTLAYKKNVSLRRLLDHAQLARKFAFEIERAPLPDVIYCCFPTIELSCAAVRFGRKHGIPVILDVRDLWPDNFLGVVPPAVRGLANLLLRPYQQRAQQAFGQCSAIVGTSEGYLQHGLNYAQRTRSDQDAVFPLGYPRPKQARDETPDASVLASLCAHGVDPKKQICWFVGMFGKTYDLRTVIEAAREFARSDEQNVQFVLSGTGDDHASLQSQAAGLPNVVFTGRIDAPQVACMSRIAHVGLMAYAKGAPQGLPNKLFEYMCAGLPIVSSLTGETQEALKLHGCGLSYTPADRDSLIAALNMLLANSSLRHRMSEAGREASDRDYAADRLYTRLAAYLEGFGQPNAAGSAWQDETVITAVRMPRYAA